MLSKSLQRPQISNIILEKKKEQMLSENYLQPYQAFNFLSENTIYVIANLSKHIKFSKIIRNPSTTN